MLRSTVRIRRFQLTVAAAPAKHYVAQLCQCTKLMPSDSQVKTLVNLRRMWSASAWSQAHFTTYAASTFSLMLSWMCKTVDTCLCLAQARDLFVASDKYDITSLNNQCAQILVQIIGNLYRFQARDELAELLDYATAIGSTEVARVSGSVCHLLIPLNVWAACCGCKCAHRCFPLLSCLISYL